MIFNETLFNCSMDNTCSQQIGYTQTWVGRTVFIIISTLGALSNFTFIIYSLVKKIKGKNRKASMKRIFLIFPFTDLLTSFYWLASSINYYNLKEIQNNMKLCSINSVFYIDVLSFQSTLINFLIFHFKKINRNPIEGILKPNKKIYLYILISFFFGALASGLTEYLSIVGISSMNTCFINTKYCGAAGYIFLIPVFLIIFAIIQLIHDLFFVRMFESDKGIRSIHNKNSCYVFIFCLMHIPLIIVILFSLILKKNNFNKDGDSPFYQNFIRFTTLFTCSIPLLISIIRQVQGLTRYECINDCLKARKRKKLLTIKTINSGRRGTIISKNEISLGSDPLEWVENHIMEYYMRDILFGVAVSLKKSKKYEVYSNEKIDLNPEDCKDKAKYEINFQNYEEYELNDNTVKNSEYLNIKVIDYAPKCFSFLRKFEKIDIDKMIESFLPKNNSQGLKKSQGKSGSFFISTDDNKYMIKTLKSDELELLKHTFLYNYINHIKKNPNSLLCRLYGMYNIILGQGDEVLIIVMRNVIGDFKDNTIVKFDLKGSTYKRTANFDFNNNNNVMKDLDFDDFEKNIMLSLSSINKLREITSKDSKFLCKSGLMDYSLFLVKLTLSKEEAEDTFGDNITEKQNNDFIQIMKDNEKSKKYIKTKTYTGQGNLHDVAHYKQYLFPSLTQGTAYIISIIDYFQIFNFFKLVESGLKTGFFQKKKKKVISCVDPETYSNRFINYINKLTDVKQFLSNQIVEVIEIENNKEYDSSDDDSDEGNNLFRKNRKDPLSFVNIKTKNELLLPIEIKPEIKSYAEQSSKMELI